jgi:hypothetical protein
MFLALDYTFNTSKTYTWVQQTWLHTHNVWIFFNDSCMVFRWYHV